MKKILICAMALSTTLSMPKAFAELSYTMPALEAGFKWNSMDLDGSTSNKQTIGFQLGGSVVIDLPESFGLRTGLFYSERPLKSDFGSVEQTGKITYADIPIHFMFKLEDYAGVYLGPSIAMKIGDEGSPASLTGVKSMVIPITFGGEFKVSENFGLNIFFETVTSNLADHVTASRGIGINAFFGL